MNLVAKPDRRIAKTRKAMLHALMELMASEGWEQVNIKMICNKADVSRSTFYLHFSNKQELLNYGFEILHTDLSIPSSVRGLDINGTFAFLPNLLNHVSEHKMIFSANQNSSTGFTVFTRFKALVDDLGMIEVDHSAHMKCIQNEQVVFLTGGIFSVLEKWNASGCREPVPKLLNRLDQLIRNIMKAMKAG